MTLTRYIPAAVVSQQLKNYMRNQAADWNLWGALDEEQKEALDLIQQSIAGIVNGRGQEADLWRCVEENACFIKESIKRQEEEADVVIALEEQDAE